MKFQNVTCIAIISLLFLGCSSTDDPENQKVDDEKLPNIVLIISDDQSWTDYSFMGHPHIKTPNIDNLAAEGLTFTRGYLPAPVCSFTSWESLRSVLTSIVFIDAVFKSIKTNNQYGDGAEELYNHFRDPHDWSNLAQDPKYADVKSKLTEWIPKNSLILTASNMGDTSFSEDIQLWERLLDGKRIALSKLFRKYYKPLLNYGLKLIPDEELIKDSIQELFFTIWERRKNLSDVKYVRSYLYTSLRRTVFRQSEVQSVRNQRDQSYSKFFSRDMSSQEKLIILQELEQEQREQLQESLETLSERQKEAVFLKFYGGLSNAEIARVMEVNKQSVYNYIYRAIEALKEYLER